VPGARQFGPLLWDLRSMVSVRGRSAVPWVFDVLYKFIIEPRVRAVVMFRASHRLHLIGLRPLAMLMKSIAISDSGADIHPAAKIGPGLCIVHSVGIVIGESVVAGSGLRIHQNVTLGDGPLPGQPLIGDRVVIGPGSAILGGISVGDGARIGANAVVVRSVPAGATAVGVPSHSTPRTGRTPASQ